MLANNDFSGFTWRDTWSSADTHLRQLNLSAVSLNDRASQSFAHLLGQLHGLKTLNLSENTSLSNQATIMWASAVAAHPHLVVMGYDFSVVSDQAEDLLRALSQKKPSVVIVY